MHRAVVSAFAVVVAIVTGCSSASVCNGNSCNCPSGQSCDFGTLGSSAKFTCDANSTCSGTGGDSSQVSCNGTKCTVTVGAGSQVTCGAGTCNVTCNGQCTVACGEGPCNITCNNGTTKGPTGCL